MILHRALAISVVVFCSMAQARTFDFKSEKFATYFGGTFGKSAAAQTAFAGATTDVSYDQSVSTNAGAQFGFLFSGEKFSLRLGVELVEPHKYSNITGSDSSGTALFNLSSTVLGILPMASIEYNIKSSALSRWFVAFGGGVSTMTVDNVYTFTAAGNAKYPGVTDYTESGSARSTALDLSTGYETLFTDTVTALFSVGYRYIPATSFKSTKDLTTGVNGKEVTGDEITNADTSARTVNNSGGYVGLAFRFYL